MDLVNLNLNSNAFANGESVVPSRVHYSREPIDFTNDRETVLELKLYQWIPRLTYACREFLSLDHSQINGIPRAIRERDTFLKMLMTDLAIRLFHSQHGRLPARLSELVPDYLSSIPIDPFADQPLMYVPEPVGNEPFLLYSTGRDGIDNGGALANIDNMYHNNVVWDLDLYLQGETGADE